MKRFLSVIAILLTFGQAWAVDLQIGPEGLQIGTGGIQVSAGGGGGGGGTLPAYASAGSSNGTSVTTAATPINTTGATLIVLCVSGVVTSITDNASTPNVYVPLSTVGGNPAATPYYKLAPVTSAAHTWTISGSYNSVVAYAVSGITSFSSEYAGGGTTNGSSAISLNPITPAAANSLVLACAAHDSDSGVTIDNGFITPISVAHLNGAHYGLSLSVKTPAAAVAVNPLWQGSTRNWRVTLASFAP